MFLALLTLITALIISSVAIFYSVTGLAAIFAAAAVPIIIMGTSLEVGKLVTALWLHKNWKTAPLILKSYLMIATVVLMFITSMGIFGFLSQAHIQQTANVGNSQAQLERIETDIARLESIITRTESTVTQLESGEGGANSAVQTQIAREQERIDAVFDRFQPLITAQQQQINSIKQDQQSALSETLQQITIAQANLNRLNTLISTNDVRAIQALIGVGVDGILGTQTQRAITTYKTNLETELASLNTRASQIREEFVSRINLAEQELTRLQTQLDSQTSQSIALIARLNEQVAVEDRGVVEARITGELERVTDARSQIDSLVDQRFEILNQIRKIEAEVGPIKYVAQLIYGEDPSQNLLEMAVKWVILIIIFVFDPLAVLLLIASQISFSQVREARLNKVSLDTVVSLSPEPVKSKPSRKRPIKKKVLATKQIVVLSKPVQKRMNKNKELFNPIDVLYREYQENGFKDIRFQNYENSDDKTKLLIKYVEMIKNKQMHFDDLTTDEKTKLAELITNV
jgi:hypothetical protein